MVTTPRMVGPAGMMLALVLLAGCGANPATTKDGVPLRDALLRTAEQFNDYVHTRDPRACDVMTEKAVRQVVADSAAQAPALPPDATCEQWIQTLAVREPRGVDVSSEGRLTGGRAQVEVTNHFPVTADRPFTETYVYDMVLDEGEWKVDVLTLTQD